MKASIFLGQSHEPNYELQGDDHQGFGQRHFIKEQSITIASILVAIRMAIGGLVKVLLPSGGGTAVQIKVVMGGGGNQRMQKNG